jgi:hypothetical protein
MGFRENSAEFIILFEQPQKGAFLKFYFYFPMRILEIPEDNTVQLRSNVFQNLWTSYHKAIYIVLDARHDENIPRNHKLASLYNIKVMMLSQIVETKNVLNFNILILSFHVTPRCHKWSQVY